MPIFKNFYFFGFLFFLTNVCFFINKAIESDKTVEEISKIEPMGKYSSLMSEQNFDLPDHHINIDNFFSFLEKNKITKIRNNYYPKTNKTIIYSKDYLGKIIHSREFLEYMFFIQKNIKIIDNEQIISNYQFIKNHYINEANNLVKNKEQQLTTEHYDQYNYFINILSKYKNLFFFNEKLINSVKKGAALTENLVSKYAKDITIDEAAIYTRKHMKLIKKENNCFAVVPADLQKELYQGLTYSLLTYKIKHKSINTIPIDCL